jgi:hypothetical protein
MLSEGNQIHNFISSSGSGTVINYGSSSGFSTSYGSGSARQKVTVPTVPVPVPVPVPQHWSQPPESNAFQSCPLHRMSVLIHVQYVHYHDNLSSLVCFKTTIFRTFAKEKVEIVGHCQLTHRLIFLSVFFTWLGLVWRVCSLFYWKNCRYWQWCGFGSGSRRRSLMTKN